MLGDAVLLHGRHRTAVHGVIASQTNLMARVPGAEDAALGAAESTWVLRYEAVGLAKEVGSNVALLDLPRRPQNRHLKSIVCSIVLESCVR